MWPPLLFSIFAFRFSAIVVGRLNGFITLLVLTIGTLFANLLLFATCDPRVRPIARPIRSYLKLAFPIFLVVGTNFLVF